MLQTAYKVTTTRNAYGDFIASGEVELPCKFRDITYQVTDSNNETIDCDAMAWFEPDSGVVRKDILKIDGEHYRVEKVTIARKLHNPNPQFIKVELKKYGVIS